MYILSSSRVKKFRVVKHVLGMLAFVRVKKSLQVVCMSLRVFFARLPALAFGEDIPLLFFIIYIMCIHCFYNKKWGSKVVHGIPARDVYALRVQ